MLRTRNVVKDDDETLAAREPGASRRCDSALNMIHYSLSDKLGKEVLVKPYRRQDTMYGKTLEFRVRRKIEEGRIVEGEGIDQPTKEQERNKDESPFEKPAREEEAAWTRQSVDKVIEEHHSGGRNATVNNISWHFERVPWLLPPGATLSLLVYLNTQSALQKPSKQPNLCFPTLSPLYPLALSHPLPFSPVRPPLSCPQRPTP